MMDHPNIAKVLDAGTTDGGRPFFVMELVKGTPITHYCDEHKLTPRAATRTVRAGVPGHSARPPEGDHPPRHQAVERAGGDVRRPAGAQGHRLRRGQGRGSVADRQDADDRVRGDGRHAGVHVAGAGQPEQPGHRHPQRCLLARRAAVRIADRHDAGGQEEPGQGGAAGDSAHRSGGGSAAAERQAEHHRRAAERGRQSWDRAGQAVAG